MFGMLLVISMVTYIDRVNVSIAGKYIRDVYGLSPLGFALRTRDVWRMLWLTIR